MLVAEWWRIPGPISGNPASDFDMVFIAGLFSIVVVANFVMWRIGR